MAKDKQTGVFVNTTKRPKLAEIIEAMKEETQISSTAELFTQALMRWWKQVKKK